jgi:bacillithiol synthase
LVKAFVFARTTNQLDLKSELKSAAIFYDQLTERTDAIDRSLKEHVISLKTKAIKRLGILEKKMVRAEKRKFESEINQLTKIKNSLFPNNSLQERNDNFSLLYAQYGEAWLKAIYLSSKGLQQEFAIITHH